jgi:hypothetical protein
MATTLNDWPLLHDIEARGHRIQVYHSPPGQRPTHCWQMLNPDGDIYITCPIQYASDAYALRDALCFLIGAPKKDFYTRILRESVPA